MTRVSFSGAPHGRASVISAPVGWVSAPGRPGAVLATLVALGIAACESPEAPSACGPIPQVTVNVGGTATATACFTDPNGDMLAYSATSSNPGVATVTMAGTAVTVTAVAKGTATVTVTATDPGGLAATQTFEVTVPNRGPEAGDPIPDIEVFVGDEESFDASGHFSDPDGDVLTYAVATSAGGVARVSVSGGVVRVEAAGQGSATVTVTATDPEGLSASQSVAVEVVNRPPAVTRAIPVQTLDVGGIATVDLSVHFGDLDGDALVYSAASADSGVAEVGVVGDTLTIRAVRQGATAVTVTATDPEGLSASQSVAVEVVNRPPAVTRAIPVQTLDVGESATVDLSVHFGDPDGDALVYSAASADSGVAVAGVSGATLTIRAVRQGATAVTVTATDPEGLSASQSIDVEVVNRPPTVTRAIPKQDLEVGGSATVDLSVHFGDPDGDTLDYAAASADSGVAVPEVSGDVLTIRAVRQGATAVTVTATDPNGLSASQSVDVEVVNRPPAVTRAIPAQTLEVGESATIDLSLHFGDPDGDALDYAAASADSGVAVSEVSGDTLTIRAVRQGATAVTVTATDPEGLSADQRVTTVVGVHPDREALVAIYLATGGPDWNNDVNWLSDAPLREWHGVVTGERGGVERLLLYGNGLSGTIPPEVGALADLEHLQLGLNDLSGPIPPELGDLANLRTLRMSQNALTVIPPELGGLAELEVLELHANRLTGPIPRELGDLANLRDLFLLGNDLTGEIPPELGNLSQLRVLFGYNNQLTGEIPPELGGLANMQWLNLSHNQLGGAIPQELGGLTNLQGLDLSDNRLGGAIPAELGSLASLHELDLSRNRLSGAIPPELGDVAQLKAMLLGDNALSGRLPDELGTLSALTRLVLDFNELVGPVPSSFGSLVDLEELTVTGNAGMFGALDHSLTGLRLDALLAGGTDLCAPREPAFETWLRTIPTRRIAFCDRATAYLTQPVQWGADPVPLVADERALLRVFLTAVKATEEGIPPVRATFFVDGTEVHAVEIPAKPTAIPTRIDEGDLAKSANAEIPAGVVRPGLEMVVEIDPQGTLDPELGVPKRIPETGRLALDVREMPVLGLTVVPFLWSEDPDSAILDASTGMARDPYRHWLLEHTRTLLPVGDLEVEAHEPVTSTSNNSFELFGQTRAIRALEGGDGHWMGTMLPPVTGPPGLATIRGWVSFAMPNPVTIAHELGHNMSLMHAPCFAGGTDPRYPQSDGSIGAWGWDFRNGGRLVPPSTPDLMSYCASPWIGDYHFTKAARYRLSDEGGSGSRAVAAPARSLLVWGGVDLNGSPFLNPAFVLDAPPALPESAGDHRITGWTAGGQQVFSVGFRMPELSEGGSSFAFVLPVRSDWAGSLASITLSGPGGEATLDAKSDRPMVILRDSVTGRIRAILRDVPGLAGGAAELAGDAGLTVLFSRGIPDANAWRR